jgi:late competence protein required for DNA uptake (superfamily II DNA/RNA helicase)
MPSIWRDYDKKLDSVYVPRCSNCGTFKEPLHVHWFFTGLYCRNCIQLRLYDDARTLEDMK